MLGISKLDDSALDRKAGDQTQEKGKFIWYCLLNLLSHQLIDHRLIYRFIYSATIFFIYLKIFVMQWRKSSWDKIKKNECYIMVILFKKTALWYSMVPDFYMWFCFPISWRCKLAKARYHMKWIRKIITSKYEKLVLLKSA